MNFALHPQINYLQQPPRVPIRKICCGYVSRNKNNNNNNNNINNNNNNNNNKLVAK